MQFANTKQWSIVYNVKERRIYFRTARSRNIRYFDFESLDFSTDAPAVVLEDIDVNLSGDVSGRFVAFTPNADRFVIGRFLRSLVGFVAKTDDPASMDLHMVKNYGFNVESYIERALQTTELIRYKNK